MIPSFGPSNLHVREFVKVFLGASNVFEVILNAHNVSVSAHFCTAYPLSAFGGLEKAATK